MSENLSDYIPLPEVSTSRVTTEALENLPFVGKTHKIGINTGAIEILCNLGGINDLTISRICETEVSAKHPDNEEVSVRSPFNPWFKMGATDLSTFVGIQPLDFDNKPKEAVWAQTSLQISPSILAQKIAEDSHTRDVRSPHSWARYLDGEIKKGIILASRIHQFGIDDAAHTKQIALSLLNNLDSVLWAYAIHPIEYITQNANPHFPTIDELFPIFLLKSLALQAGVYALWRRSGGNLNPEGLGFRLSVFGPVQFDRLLIQMAVSRFMTVAKAID